MNLKLFSAVLLVVCLAPSMLHAQVPARVPEEAPARIHPLPSLREQALAYQNHIKALLVDYFHKVAQSERATIKVILEKQGHADIAKNIEDI